MGAPEVPPVARPGVRGLRGRGRVHEVGDGHTACAGTESECAGDAADGAKRCALDGRIRPSAAVSADIATAFSGTDKHSVPLESAAQVERLGKHSVTGALGEPSGARRRRRRATR